MVVIFSPARPMDSKGPYFINKNFLYSKTDFCSYISLVVVISWYVLGENKISRSI